jgi:hypothetical protein
MILARVLGLLVAATLLAATSAVSAAWPRPYDAPVPRPSRAVPDVTPEYASVEEAGIKLVYHPVARERAHALLSRAVAIRAELSAELGRDVLGSVEIRVAAASAQMASLAPGDVPSGAPGVVFRDHRLVVMSLSSGLGGEPPDLEERLRHELAHLALDEAVGGHDLPRWFHEGFAVHFSGEDASQRTEALCIAALHDGLLGLGEVDARFPDGAAKPSLAVAEASDFVRFLLAKPLRSRFATMIERLRAGEPLDRALPLALGADLDTIELRWRKEMAKRYSFVPVFTGATLLWVVVALGISLRRRRIALAKPVDDPLAAAERLSIHEPSEPHLPEDPETLAQTIPPDPEVPKVEHRGRWYTLH